MIVTTAIKRIRAMHGETKIVQGGQGAGKTYAILAILIDLSVKSKLRISVLQKHRTKMVRTVVRDFIALMTDLGKFDRAAWNASNLVYTFPHGSYIEFLGLDSSAIGKGFRRDVLYFNEANEGIDLETYSNLASRAKRHYIDFNPDAEFWAHTDLIGKKNTDFVVLTYKDNEAISPSEREAILDYKRNADEGGANASFWLNKWRVYGCGELGVYTQDNPFFVEFNRDKHIVSVTDNPLQPLYIGIDFNVHNFSAIVCQTDEFSYLNIIDEIVFDLAYNDDMISEIKARYPNRIIYLAPDASGVQRNVTQRGSNDNAIAQFKDGLLLGRTAILTGAYNDRKYLSSNLSYQNSKDLCNSVLKQVTVRISPKCACLIKDLERAAWLAKEGGGYGLYKGAGDSVDNMNACDCFRYIVQACFWNKRKERANYQ